MARPPLTVPAQPRWGFVSVAYDTDIDAAPRWSATEIGGRGIADGAIQVFVEPNFAETIAMAVTGMVLPEDVATVELDRARRLSRLGESGAALRGHVRRRGDARSASGGEIDCLRRALERPRISPPMHSSA